MKQLSQTTPSPTPVLTSDSPRRQVLVYWIYAYLVLLIFEGVIRKWLLADYASLQAAVLIIRDPVAIIIYALAIHRRMLPSTAWIKWWGGAVGVFALLGVWQLIEVPGLRASVVAFGIRSYLLHVPLIFIIADVLREKEIMLIARWWLRLTVPMTVLVAMQFTLPPDHFLNKAAGEGEQIRSAFEKIRPPGTFSYNNGAALFYLMASAFLVWSFLKPGIVSRAMRVIAAVAIIAVLPLSGSRGFVIAFALLLVFAFLGGHFNRRLYRISLLTTACFALIFVVLSRTTLFQEGMEVFMTRWNSAIDESSSSAYNAIVTRTMQEFSRPLNTFSVTPIAGFGLGMGSNVASKLTEGTADFLLAEGEWERSVMEMGPLVAPLWLGGRCAFVFFVMLVAWRALRRGEALAWLLVGAVIDELLKGVMEQPTGLGFITAGAGLSLAASRFGGPARRPAPRPSRRTLLIPPRQPQPFRPRA